MIQYNPKTWFSLIFDFYSRYVMRVLFPLILFIGVFTTVLCFLIIDVLGWHYAGAIGFHSILGVILGLFLVLRTNTAYDRWWEGRKLWGQLVNDSRQLAVKLASLIPKEEEEDRIFFRRMIPNVAFAIKEHLRDSILIGEMDTINDEIKNTIIKSKHRPNCINRLIYQRVVGLAKKGIITQEQLIVLDKEIKGFTDIVGACERIKSTPIPYSYSMFIKKFLFIYSITLPFSFMWEFEYWCAPVVMLAFYFLISIELIAEEIEDPFGNDINDLPLDEISYKIKSNVSEIMS
ncbi:bestrophin family protein [Marinoscillum sp. MHG1-6]|uniref:bestrophin family protein n=1 Tax=Marinoscillum sp. MHG1-6 TaxID=2959627 RepID=UPI002158231F|nr:bestrophin family ion channel [Marinoscillum sp. MHG1-6]